MTDIVVELKKRNWTDKKIAKELGMDSDEVLRLCQMSGLAEMFKDTEFTKSWDIDSFDENDIVEEFFKMIPDFGHKETGKYLDGKM